MEKVTTFEVEVVSGHVFGGWGLNDYGVFLLILYWLSKINPEIGILKNDDGCIFRWCFFERADIFTKAYEGLLDYIDLVIWWMWWFFIISYEENPGNKMGSYLHYLQKNWCESLKLEVSIDSVLLFAAFLVIFQVGASRFFWRGLYLWNPSISKQSMWLIEHGR